LKKVFISAGEASGDRHASALVSALKTRIPDLEFVGLGGDLMAAQGVRLIYDLRTLAVAGFWEVIKRLGEFRQVFHNTVAEIERQNPDLIILVDYPGMNLRLAKALKSKGYRIVYFILPQVWAWKADRIKALAANTDLQLAILPFEPELFAGLNANCEFIGHPLLDRLEEKSPEKPFRTAHELNESARILALLPGSREVEIKRHYPILLRAAKQLQSEFRELVPVTAVRNEIGLEYYRELEKGESIKPVHCIDDRYGLLRGSDVSIVASGTATVEAALCGRPFCVVYRTGLITYLIARSLINLDMVGLVNIVAGRKIVP
jgi:lipid-A-disaccharide synthase